MSIQVGIGLSTEKDPVLAAKEAIRKAKSSFPTDKISLAIVFATIDLSTPTLLKTIGSYLNDTPIIGCSAAAVIYGTTISKEGVVVLLLSFPQGTHFNTSCVKEIKSKASLGAGEELGEKLLYAFQGVRRDINILLSGAFLEDNSSLILGLQERLGKSFPLVGGCASDNFAFKKTYVYFDHEVIIDAACSLLLGGKLNFGFGVQHGWKPLGKPRIVTKSYGNAVFEIDGAPAVDFYKEYLTLGLEDVRSELEKISILYPIGIYLPGVEEYLLRSLLSIQEDGSLIFQGNVPQNCQIRLMIGTKESCLESAKYAAQEVKDEFRGKKIDFALVFNSISRYILLRRGAEKELEIIKEQLGQNTPLIGFYTYGEFAPLKSINYQGITRFHNQTVTILGVGA